MTKDCSSVYSTLFSNVYLYDDNLLIVLFLALSSDNSSNNLFLLKPLKTKQNYRSNSVLHTGYQQRLQIFKKLGVKFYDPFLSTERLQRNLKNFTFFCHSLLKNLPLDLSEIFNIFRINVLLFFFKYSRKFRKKLKTMVISKPVDERSKNF